MLSLPALTSCGQDHFKFWRSTHPGTDIWHGLDEFKFGRSIPRSAGRTTPLVWTSCGQDEFKFVRSTTTSAGRNYTSLVLDILWSRWFQIWQIYPYICWQIHHPDILTSLVQNEFQIWQIYPLDLVDWCTLPALTSCGQDQFKYWRSTLDLLADLSPGTWHLVVKMSSNLADLSLDLLAEATFPAVLTSCGQDEFKFDRSTPTSTGSSNLPILTSCGQDEFKIWQIYS